MTPTFFAEQADFRKWFEENYKTEKELLVGFYKVGSGKPSMSWSQSVDEALCFGWIDGIRRTIDDESYSIRFTPRRPTSVWSAVNIKKMEEMIPLGLVKPEGILAFEKHKHHKSSGYTHEIVEMHFTPMLEGIFSANTKAWEFFQKQAPYYKRVLTKWVVTAKQETTQMSRLEKLIIASEAGKRL